MSNEHIIKLLHNFALACRGRRPNILVVGDAMIDEYYDVSIDRISPEFPIPVLKHAEDYPNAIMPGGAANTAYQFHFLNTEIRLAAFTNYNYGLNDLCLSHGIKSVISLDEYPHLQIPIKKRYYQSEIPFCRIDVETENYGLTHHEINHLNLSCLNTYLSSKTKCDVVIFSDYDKGIFRAESSIINGWNSAAGLTIVDPKTFNSDAWRYCDVFKPNYKDAVKFSGLTAPGDQCSFFVEELNCQNVVITDEGNCVHVYESSTNKFETYRPKERITPRSVIGAGDCFTAFLATALAHDFSIFDAARIAFHAGLTYVQNVRNHPVTPHDIIKRLSPEDAKFFIKDADLFSKKIVFTNGCFDLFHVGHLSTLQFARSQGDILVVALNDDASISRLKGPSRPIVPLMERMRLIASLSCVDFVTYFSEDDPRELINQIKPNIIVKGEDWKHKPMPDIFGDIPIIFAPTVTGISTTDIIEKIRL